MFVYKLHDCHNEKQMLYWRTTFVFHCFQWCVKWWRVWCRLLLHETCIEYRSICSISASFGYVKECQNETTHMLRKVGYVSWTTFCYYTLVHVSSLLHSRVTLTVTHSPKCNCWLAGIVRTRGCIYERTVKVFCAVLKKQMCRVYTMILSTWRLGVFQFIKWQ